MHQHDPSLQAPLRDDAGLAFLSLHGFLADTLPVLREVCPGDIPTGQRAAARVLRRFQSRLRAHRANVLNPSEQTRLNARACLRCLSHLRFGAAIHHVPGLLRGLISHCIPQHHADRLPLLRGN